MLLDHHQALLVASAISPEVAEARGYYSAHGTKAELARLGFGSNQRLVPALVIPQWNVWGECTHHQLRADHPRERDGKAVKYETPARATQIIDIPPTARALLDDPTVPLVITEGSRKADAAVSRGMCAISVNGVYGFRGKNDKGGKTALPDWELVAVNGRMVLLAFDSDATTKREVHQALRRLRALLEMRKAKVLIVVFPSEASGRKVGLDDWLAADTKRGLADLERLAVADLPDLDPRPAADTFEDVEDEHGWVVLEDLRDLVVRFVWFPTAQLADAIVLWIVHTYLLDVFVCTPRLHVRSPMKRSGKSRLLEVLELLVRKPMPAALVTAAVIYRSIELDCPTLLIDEVDRLFGDDVTADPSGLVAVLNAGFQPGTPVPRMVGQGVDMVPKYFPTYAAVAMAGIGTIPDTIADRSITIRLERRPPAEAVERFRPRQVKPVAAELARRAAAWSARHAEALEAARPTFPAGMHDRAENMWEPLFAIADAAGGDWPTRARDVAVNLTALQDHEDVDATLELRLLVDIHETWPAHMDRRFSAEIVRTLNDIDGAPWADRAQGIGLTTGQLAKRLKPFGAEPQRIRIGSETKRGYYGLDLWPAFVRYGVIDEQPPPTDPAEAPQTPQTEHPWSAAMSDRPHTNGDPTAAHRSTRDVPVVADVAPSGGESEQVDASSDGWETIA